MLFISLPLYLTGVRSRAAEWSESGEVKWFVRYDHARSQWAVSHLGGDGTYYSCSNISDLACHLSCVQRWDLSRSVPAGSCARRTLTEEDRPYCCNLKRRRVVHGHHWIVIVIKLRGSLTIARRFEITYLRKGRTMWSPNWTSWKAGNNSHCLRYTVAL